MPGAPARPPPPPAFFSLRSKARCRWYLGRSPGSLPRRRVSPGCCVPLGVPRSPAAAAALLLSRPHSLVHRHPSGVRSGVRTAGPGGGPAPPVPTARGTPSPPPGPAAGLAGPGVLPRAYRPRSAVPARRPRGPGGVRSRFAPLLIRCWPPITATFCCTRQRAGARRVPSTGPVSFARLLQQNGVIRGQPGRARCTGPARSHGSPVLSCPVPDCARPGSFPPVPPVGGLPRPPAPGGRPRRSPRVAGKVIRRSLPPTLRSDDTLPRVPNRRTASLSDSDVSQATFLRCGP